MIPPKEFCDFEKEPGKLWFRSPMIMNGVCCVCVGYVNLTKLDGTARLEFDNEYARVSGGARDGARELSLTLLNKCFSLKISDVRAEQLQIQKNQTTIDHHQLQHQKRRTQTIQGQEMVKYQKTKWLKLVVSKHFFTVHRPSLTSGLSRAAIAGQLVSPDSRWGLCKSCILNRVDKELLSNISTLAI